jgi:hypothetical protein
MATFSFRSNNVTTLSGGYLAPGAGYSVSAYNPGAQVASASSGSTFTVRANHGITAGNRLLINPIGTSTFSGIYSVASTTATTITLSSGTYTVAAGDYIFNLEGDSGSSSPNYDGSGVPTYSVMDGALANTNSTVISDAGGNYFYWHASTVDIWELIRSAAGTPVAITIVPAAVAGTGGGGGGVSTFSIFTTATLPAASSAYENTLIIVKDTGSPAVLKWAALQSDGSYAWNDLSFGI